MNMENAMNLNDGNRYYQDALIAHDRKRREADSVMYIRWINQAFIVTKEEMIILNQIAVFKGYNRAVPTEDILNAMDHIEWILTPVIFHDHKDLELTERHFRCTVRPYDPTGNVSETYVLDIPLDFQTQVAEVKGMIEVDSDHGGV